MSQKFIDIWKCDLTVTPFNCNIYVCVSLITLMIITATLTVIILLLPKNVLDNTALHRIAVERLHLENPSFQQINHLVRKHIRSFFSLSPSLSSLVLPLLPSSPWSFLSSPSSLLPLPFLSPSSPLPPPFLFRPPRLVPSSPSISFISLYFSFLSSPIISSQSQLGHSHYTNSLRCCQSWCHVAAGLYRDVSQYDHIADTGIHEQWPDRANQFTHPDSKVTLPHDGLYPPYYRLTGLCSSYSVHSPLQLSFYSHQKFIYMKMRNSTETGWSSLFNSDIGGL